MTTHTTTLYRPTGDAELAKVAALNYRAWPPRLPDQPIFYPVCNERYAREIAERGNARNGKRGFDTRFEVLTDHLSTFQPQIVGARRHEEYWIPANELEAFDAALVGRIEVVAAFGGAESPR